MTAPRRTSTWDIRTVYVRQADARSQLDDWANLRVHHLEGAPRRLLGKNGAGDSARYRRDQGAFRKISTDADVVIIEIGGTVGDIESLPFLEAVRQMRLELGPENSVLVT